MNFLLESGTTAAVCRGRGHNSTRRRGRVGDLLLASIPVGCACACGSDEEQAPATRLRAFLVVCARSPAQRSGPLPIHTHFM